MLNPFLQIRSEERRAVWSAFFTLFGIMAAHALQETARDTLFLSRISIERLPLVYLIIAFAALLMTQFEARFIKKKCTKNVLVSLLLFSAFVSLVFWFLVGLGYTWVFYALYVWSGVFTTLILLRFWSLVGTFFTIRQAKRLYALIGAGSVAGAIAGTGMARILTSMFAPHHLILLAAVFLLKSAGISTLMSRLSTDLAVEQKEGGLWTFSDRIKSVVSNTYARRIAGLVLISTLTFTFVDFLFKRIVADRVPAQNLGEFLSQIYFWVNVFSLFVQVFLVGWLSKILSMHQMLAVFPLLLMAGSMGVMMSGFLGGGLLAVNILKGIDGSMRHSLHRTASELLFVPMTEPLRSHVKVVIDVVGQRGGQALASLFILAAMALGANHTLLAGVVVLLTAFWIIQALELKSHYLNLFRQTLQAGQHKIDFPDLDVASLESLIVALNSQNDLEVIASLDFLVEQGKMRLIPALILYHPSESIVLHALEVFSKSNRKDFVPIADRLIQSTDPEHADIRGGALRARLAVAPDEKLLRTALEAWCPTMFSTALVGLAGRGWMNEQEMQTHFHMLIQESPDWVKLELAKAIRHQPGSPFEDILIKLSQTTDLSIKMTVIQAMREMPSLKFLPALLPMLSVHQLRSEVRKTMMAMGSQVLPILDEAMNNPSLPASVRVHLPRTINRFDPQMAADTLMKHLAQEKNGMVRFKILRALQPLCQNHPNLILDASVLHKETESTIKIIYQFLDYRLIFEQTAQRMPHFVTEVHSLLYTFFKDKETHALERLFRLFNLQYPTEEFDQIYRGLQNKNKNVRASSLELVNHLLEPPLRNAVLGIIDDLPEAERLSYAAAFYTPHNDDYKALLRKLLQSSSESLRTLTAYHIKELSLSFVADSEKEAEKEPAGLLAKATQRLLSDLEELQRNLAYEP